MEDLGWTGFELIINTYKRKDRIHDASYTLQHDDKWLHHHEHHQVPTHILPCDKYNSNKYTVKSIYTGLVELTKQSQTVFLLCAINHTL